MLKSSNFYPRGVSYARVLEVVVCLSVCVCQSVCVSHAGIVSKRLNENSRKQHHVIAQGLYFFWRQQLLVEARCPGICAQSDPPPFRTPEFRPISAHSASTVRAGENSSIITNRKSTVRFPLSHRWTLCVTPKFPKGWLKTKMFTLGAAFYFFVAGNRRHFKFNMWVKHSKSQSTDDKPSLKWAWPRHVIHFKFLVPLRYLGNGLS